MTAAWSMKIPSATLCVFCVRDDETARYFAWRTSLDGAMLLYDTGRLRGNHRDTSDLGGTGCAS